MKRIGWILAAAVLMAACAPKDGSLPRGKASEALDKGFADYLQAVEQDSTGIHSILVVSHGKVVEEHFFAPDTAHVLHSVSKTFTSAAVGFAIAEGLLSLDERIVDIFPECVPENPQELLSQITVRNLLTMNVGHGKDPSGTIRKTDGDWIRAFMEWPIVFEPGTCFCYNSLATYLLSAAVQKRSGEKVVDYLDTRLWKPLGIPKPHWDESPAGITTGGWGLYLRTEDMAKMGLCLLGGGRYGGKQVIPADWVREMSSAQVPSVNAGRNEQQVREILADPDSPLRAKYDPALSDWVQGYGYQMWRCRHNAFRADGAYGQYILVLPDQDAVIAVTAQVRNMQAEINQIWDHIFPAL